MTTGGRGERPQKPRWEERLLQDRGAKIALLCLWAGVLLLCFCSRERFTVDGVLSYTPESPALAALFLLLLFALKSLSVFVYSGILYMASGILFPLPIAIALNVAGTAVMVSLPYFLGRRIGAGLLDRLMEKYPKLEVLRKIQTDHELLLSFVTRTVNILPSDILSLCMGASGIRYGKYLAGSVAGMFFSITAFPVMGSSIMDPASPRFLLSVLVQIAAAAVSLGGGWLYRRRRERSTS